MFGVLAEEGHDLDGGGSGADDGDAFVRKLVQSAGGVSAGVLIVPARGVKAVAGEVVDSWDARELRTVVGSGSHDQKAGAELVAAIRADPPALDRRIPAQRPNHGTEQRLLVEAKMTADPLALLEDLAAIGVAVLGEIAHLLEQRHVAIRLDVALHPGVAVPIPGAAEVAAHLDDADVADAGFLHTRSREQAGKASTEDGDIEIFRDRIPFDGRRVGIDFVEVGEIFRGLDVLPLAFGPHALVALAVIALPKRGNIDVLGCSGWFAAHLLFPSRACSTPHFRSPASASAEQARGNLLAQYTVMGRLPTGTTMF